MSQLLKTALASGLLASQVAMAQTAITDSYFRVDTAYSYLISDADHGGTDGKIKGRHLDLSATYQANTGLYAGMGYARHSIDEIKIGGVKVDEDDDEGGATLHFGYRATPGFMREGSYLGGGVFRAVSYGGEDMTGFRLFQEADTDRAFSQIFVSLASGGGAEEFAFGGRYLWCITPDFGLGMNWKAAVGDRDAASGDDAEYYTAAFGINVMFRGKPSF